MEVAKEAKDLVYKILTNTKTQGKMPLEQWLEGFKNFEPERVRIRAKINRKDQKDNAYGCLLLYGFVALLLWVFSRNWSPISALVEWRYSTEGLALYPAMALLGIAAVMVFFVRLGASPKPVAKELWARHHLLSSLFLPLLCNLAEDLKPEDEPELELVLTDPRQVPTYLIQDSGAGLIPRNVFEYRKLLFAQIKLRFKDGARVHIRLEDRYRLRKRTQRGKVRIKTKEKGKFKRLVHVDLRLPRKKYQVRANPQLKLDESDPRFYRFKLRQSLVPEPQGLGPWTIGLEPNHFSPSVQRILQSIAQAYTQVSTLKKSA